MTETPDRPDPSPVLHEKRTYRQRRLMDAARVAPVLALFLWMVPLFWPQSADGGVSSATAIIYIFVVWAAVIVLTWVLSIALSRIARQDPQDDR